MRLSFICVVIMVCFPFSALSKSLKKFSNKQQPGSIFYPIPNLANFQNSWYGIHVRGGAVLKASSRSGENGVTTSSSLISKPQGILAAWGVFQVLGILGQALKRLIPIAVEPLKRGDLRPFHWGLGAIWVAFMAYTEGYKAFHQKFCPLVVQRANQIWSRRSILNVLFAGPYSMGLFGATKKRMIVSWSITLGVALLVGAVKRLPYPYRSIIDAGVVVGLSMGILSLGFLVTKSVVFGQLPGVDPCLPKESA